MMELKPLFEDDISARKAVGNLLRKSKSQGPIRVNCKDGSERNVQNWSIKKENIVAVERCMQDQNFLNVCSDMSLSIHWNEYTNKKGIKMSHYQATQWGQDDLDGCFKRLNAQGDYVKACPVEDGRMEVTKIEIEPVATTDDGEINFV